MVRLEIQEFVGNDEITNVGLLTAKIIEIMRDGDGIEIYTKEPISAIDIGLIDLVDSLVDYYKWDTSMIQFKYGNHKETTLIDRYKMSVTDTGDPIAKLPIPIQFDHWDHSKLFGMFIGRLNKSRLHALSELQRFRYKDLGLTSMNQSVESESVKTDSLLTYIKESDTTWSELQKIKPYSDIGPVLDVPILPPDNFVDWGEVYKQIPIEIVCETSDSPNNWQITEKLIRCIMYRRPFLLISSPGLALQLSTDSQMVKDLELVAPLKLFQHAIPIDYDNLSGKERVDAVFDILYNLIETDDIHIYGKVKKCIHLICQGNGSKMFMAKMHELRYQGILNITIRKYLA